MKATPARILDAADDLFAGRGFAGVSVRDIAEQAEVNKALVFYHFDNKASLFERVMDRYYEAHADALSAGMPAEGTLGQRLHGLLDAYLDFVENNRRYFQLVQREIAEGSDRLDLIRRGLRLLYDRVAEILTDELPASGPLAVRQFFVSFSGLVNTYYVYAPVQSPRTPRAPALDGGRHPRPIGAVTRVILFNSGNPGSVSRWGDGAGTGRPWSPVYARLRSPAGATAATMTTMATATVAQPPMPR
jgi:AcrR family transcriptional regulator